MKKIDVKENTFFLIVLALALILWALLAASTDMVFLMFFLTYIVIHIFVKLCLRYVVEIKYDNGASTD